MGMVRISGDCLDGSLEVLGYASIVAQPLRESGCEFVLNTRVVIHGTDCMGDLPVGGFGKI